MDEENGT